jgi:hypothetical protein
MISNTEIRRQSYLTYKTNNNTSFKGALDSGITQVLMTIDTNPMVNAAAVDVGSMVIPRTYIDTKKRNKYAGFETLFRELTGTVIVCLSAGVAAMGIAAVHNKIMDKNINISPKLWATDDTFDVLKSAWLKSNKDVDSYVENILQNISGIDGRNLSKWKDIKWDKVEWYNKSSWDKINWKDPKWANIVENTKSGSKIIKALSDLIKDKNADKRDIKKVFEIIEHRIANSLYVSQSVDLSIGDQKVSASLKHLIRDTHDLGKQIFNTGINLERAEAKLKSINRFKSVGAVGIVALLGLSNQYLNRYITKKRTGKDDFVGEQNYEKAVSTGANKENNKSEKVRLTALKAVASAGILALSLWVMKIKSPAEFIKKIELKSAVTSGNAIKTIFTATLIGRFIAARNKNELRESCTRDYLAFLNWLVLGGFVSKGVAQLLFDRKQNNLFNINENGSRGIKRWLNDTSLKSHAEIASKGKEFARKNIWKLNVAHAAGLLYSGLALGCALPLLNIFITNGHKKQNSEIKSLSGVNDAAFAGTNAFNPNVFAAFYNQAKKLEIKN